MRVWIKNYYLHGSIKLDFFPFLLPTKKAICWFPFQFSSKLETFRSSRPEVFLLNGALKICSKFTREHPCRSVISLLKSHFDGCSPVNLLYIFRTPFPKNSSGWLLLNISTLFFSCASNRSNLSEVLLREDAFWNAANLQKNNHAEVRFQ